jgi:hypothetical protein
LIWLLLNCCGARSGWSSRRPRAREVFGCVRARCLGY